jgi:hypothetical protein
VADGALGDGKISFLINKAGEIDRVSVALEPNVKEIVFTRKKDNNVAAESGK